MPPAIKNEKYAISDFLKHIWYYTDHYHRRIIFWSSVRLLSTLQGLLPPLIIARIIDGLSSKATSVTDILWLIAALTGNNLLRNILRLKSKFWVNQYAEQVRLKTRQQETSRLLDFDLEWHESQASGKKITVISKGADSIKSFIRFLSSSGGGLDIFVDVFAVLIIFLGFNFKFFVLALLNTSIYLLVNQYLNRNLVKRWHRLNKQFEGVIGKNYEYFSNIHLIKSLGIGNQVNRAIFNREHSYTQKAIQSSKMGFNKWIIINSISQIFTGISLILIISDIYYQRMSVGSFFIYMGYINRLQDGLSGVADWIDELINYKLVLFRMIQLIKTGKTTTICGHLDFPSPVQTLSINNLSFKYKLRPDKVLKNVNLAIHKSEKIGLVGKSGSGKSTLVKLLLKLYLSKKGSIKINNINIKSIATDKLRPNIAIVPQESEIFNLSFKENITIASESQKFNPSLYNLALTISQCEPILEKIKHNHNRLLGEKGIRLSGGERQRLGIARAIYKNSPIIIFDESTSSLDSITEEKILHSIEEYLKDKIVIWIAHRLSTLRFTNRIVVFDKGSICESGGFDELVALKKHFYQLWQIQKRTKMD
ncbi:MAG: ABC transporter ATP-binding protein [Candidatus Shapirobacteria bacterium]|jgi:ABC-type multidrug transport system fused ATPase/permease subunit